MGSLSKPMESTFLRLKKRFEKVNTELNDGS